MFRNPRENAHRPPADALLPSTGRPPSPVGSRQPSSGNPHASPLQPAPPATMNGDKILAKGTRATPAKNTSKAKPLSNGNIVNLFKKQEQLYGQTLFVGESPTKIGRGPASAGGIVVGLGHEDAAGDASAELARFNESPSAVKRRKLSHSSDGSLGGGGGGTDAAKNEAAPCTPPPDNFDDERNPANPVEAKMPKGTSRGPFLDDSDSEDDEEWVQRRENQPEVADIEGEEEVLMPREDMKREEEEEVEAVPIEHRPRPMLRRASTSIPDQSGFDEFDDMGDFEDEWEEGEEFMERKYMREQERFEQDAAETIPTCPICSIDMTDVSDQDASVHVNNCLDGNPTPLPKSTPPAPIASSKEVTKETGVSSDHFKKPARMPRPGQKNPFELGKPHGTSSAFSRLMSGHAEDAAWADAAASETASRGRPSYQRTCPFYKILPGLSICVDAFRYGAVEGCNAYFLSHFHSDHYVGLTASWCHGPIYCSRPTANLVKQQLRVNPKYVVALEWEQKVEVPGTQGVHVTMIPANHCPGSSLYLFEKVLGKGANPKVQRILHCGDFRACPAHVEHPLLQPEVRDAVTGKTAQQRIDVCYLDTTYCNPKWAFPSQEDVIKACADMCISLSKSQVDHHDAWEKTKKQRAGGSMTKFVRSDSGNDGKSDESGPPAKDRGKLLVVIGTYSIGKERICLGIARALNSKIYAPAGKQRICAALEDKELLERLTSNPREAQVHMTPLFEIRAETLADYMTEFSDCFSRAVGFRPTGWNYRPPGGRFTESPPVHDVLYSDNWKSTYSMKDLVPQRGSNSKASTFGVPYSEHSSFRELSMFCCALRIDKIIPTVNVGSAKSRERMKLWCERWSMERKKNGFFKPVKADGTSEWYPGQGTMELRTTL